LSFYSGRQTALLGTCTRGAEGGYTGGGNAAKDGCSTEMLAVATNTDFFHDSFGRLQLAISPVRARRIHYMQQTEVTSSDVCPEARPCLELHFTCPLLLLGFLGVGRTRHYKTRQSLSQRYNSARSLGKDISSCKISRGSP
ncbi:unnamed protein product, partial [Ectocarpus sp. 13 AM-2016]